MEGVPVELNVATIFSAIMALLPTPVTTTLPLDLRMSSTEPINSEFRLLFSFLMESASISKVRFARFKILPDDFTQKIFFQVFLGVSEIVHILVKQKYLFSSSKNTKNPIN